MLIKSRTTLWQKVTPKHLIVDCETPKAPSTSLITDEKPRPILNSCQKEPTMVASSKVNPTMCNRYPNQEKEYIFCVKGRPFGCLVSPHLPTPSSTLVDYNMVRDLGIKMTDLQYTKFPYCGHKMRVLGKISMTVQTIHDGFVSGNIPFKANVVLDLAKNLEIDSVAGVKMRKRLSGEDAESVCTSSGAPSTCSTPTSSPRSPPPSPTPTTPGRSPSPRRTPPASPPGFPAQPMHCDQVKIVKRPQIDVTLPTSPNPSVLTANILALEATFLNADIMTSSNGELHALHGADPGGKVQLGVDGSLTFITLGGLTYERGHGRNKCSARCQDAAMDEIPNNCGYNSQWLIPYGFRPCGENCQGAYCGCIDQYY